MLGEPFNFDVNIGESYRVNPKRSIGGAIKKQEAFTFVTTEASRCA